MTRYTLADQVHFVAEVPGVGEVVVTLQHWQADAGTAVYVTTHNGIEARRKFTDDPRDIASLRDYFTDVRTRHAGDILSEQAATDEVVRRGGPGPRHCPKADCTSTIPIPFAAAHCAAGCLPADDRGRVEFLSVTSRRPALTVITGGKS